MSASPTAGYNVIPSVSSDDIIYTALGPHNNVGYSPKRTMLPKTYFNQGDSSAHKFAGLQDGQISLSGDYDHTDTGQQLVLTQFASGGDLYVKVLWDGTHGYKVKGIVSSCTIKAAVDGKATLDATVEFNGVPTAI